MSPFLVRPSIVAASLALVTSPFAARAQGASLSAIAISARQDLLGDPLVGGAIGVRLATRVPGLAFRLGANWSGGRADRLGAPCAGLVEPGTCPPEQVRDQARLIGAGGGTVLRVLGGPHLSIALTGDLTLAWLRVDTRGRSSGRALTASKPLWGGLVGAEATWAPISRVPLVLELGGGVGGLTPVGHEVVADGYTPFERGFALALLRLGVAWQP